MEDVFVGLGSNLGDSARILLKAWDLLGKQDGIELRALSPPFISAPVDMTSNHWFTNAVGHLATRHSAHRLLDILLEAENSLGRARNTDHRGYQDRTVDLDLLYFGSSVYDDPRLTLPHPRLTERLFVIAPLAVLAPDFVDPAGHKSIADLYQLLQNKITAKKIPNQEISQREWPDTL